RQFVGVELQEPEEDRLGGERDDRRCNEAGREEGAASVLGPNPLQHRLPCWRAAVLLPLTPFCPRSPGSTPSMARDYLQKILTARVYDVAIETPLDPAPNLSARIGNRVLLKREDMQSVFSFKLRGAYNKMSGLPRDKLKRGVIAASAGNHAQGVALAAQKLGCRAVIVMPVTTPRIKIDAVAARGAAVVLIGDFSHGGYKHAKTLERKRNLTFVPPYDDPDVIAGQGTIG